MTHICLAAIIALLIILLPLEANRVEWTPSDYSRVDTWLVIFRGVVGILLVAILVFIACKEQYRWIYITYTIQSLSLLTLRLVFAALGTLSSDVEILAPIRVIADVLRAPALIQATIVVSVWWLVLVPLVYYFIWDNPDQRQGFTNLNIQPFLVLIHLLNLPIAAVDFIGARQCLTTLDLWVSLAVGMGYLMFYLLALDANGIHLYAILSPRSFASGLVYLGLLGLYLGCFCLWNKVVRS